MDETTRTLGDRYEVGDVLGRGGMAEVHLGRDSRLGRTVAIKVLRSDMARDPVFHARFRREAQSAAAMNHPSIVAVYDTGEDVLVESGGGSVRLPYIVMEHVAGRTLRDLLISAGGGGLGTQRAVAITADVLTALDYSHLHGIVHRDIKPANVMVTPSGDVKVMDFGIARAVADTSATMTQTSAVIGTAQYLSPEQARGLVVDARTDLYSAGCLLYELLTGRPPFVGDSPVSVAYQHVREIPEPPSTRNAAVDEAIDRVVLKALAKDREDRYATAAEFREDLLAAEAGHAVGAPAVAVAAAVASSGLPTTTEATRALASAGYASVLQQRALDTPTGEHTAFHDALSPTTGRSGATALAQAPRGLDGFDDADDDGPPHRRRWAVLVPLLVAALVVAAGAGWWVHRVASRVTVPTVTGSTLAAATAKLGDVDLDVHQSTSASTEPAGTVVRQSPASGRHVDRGSTVDVVVSTGPKAVAVPDLAQMTEVQASNALEAVGLVEGKTSTTNDPGTPAGRVISSSPAAGSSAVRGSAVDLTLSSGKVTLPDLRGKTSAAAQAALKDLGLTPFVTSTTSSTATPGTVSAQSPQPGLVDPASQVTLVIATAAPTATATATATASPSATATDDPSATSTDAPSATDGSGDGASPTSDGGTGSSPSSTAGAQRSSPPADDTASNAVASAASTAAGTLLAGGTPTRR